MSISVNNLVSTGHVLFQYFFKIHCLALFCTGIKIFQNTEISYEPEMINFSQSYLSSSTCNINMNQSSHHPERIKKNSHFIDGKIMLERQNEFSKATTEIRG